MLSISECSPYISFCGTEWNYNNFKCKKEADDATDGVFLFCSI